MNDGESTPEVTSVTDNGLFLKLFADDTAPTLIIDPIDGAIRDANDAAATFYGWTVEQLRRMNIRQIDVWKPDGVREEMNHTRALKPVHFQFRHRLADGSTRDVDVFSRRFTAHGKDLLHSIIHDITDRIQAEFERETTVGVLRLANECTCLRELVRRMVQFFREVSGCDAVGIRLREGDDFPYCEARGFPAEFIALEKHLCRRDRAGQLVRDDAGNPVIECMCGDVIGGRVDPSKPYFTDRGSFWSNCTTDLLATTPQVGSPTPKRNRCNSQGYESVALIPLRVGDERLGLLQLNDRAKDFFSLQTISLWERLADYLAIALSRFLAQDALSRSEETYHSLFEGLPNGVAYCEMVVEDGGPDDFIFLNVNSAFENLTGLNTVAGRRVSDLLPGIRESDPEMFRIYGRVARTGKPEVFEHFMTALQKWFTVSVHSPKKGSFVTVFEIIDERKNAEAQLRESEARFRTLVECAPDAIFVHVNGRYAFLNPAACRLFGAGSELQLLGTEHLDRIAPEYREAVTERMNLREEEKQPSPLLEMECLRLDGTWITVETTAVVVMLKGTPAHIVFMRDIAERKQAEAERNRLEEQVRQVQKLEALGVLAGGIAHDFNNLLGGAFGYLDLAREGLAGSGNEKIAGYLDHALSIFERTKNLTGQLLTFAKGGSPVKKSGDLATLVRETAQFILTGSNIATEFRLAGDLWSCAFDENMIGQVLDNLIINAKQAMPDGGSISISAQNLLLGEREVASLPPGAYVRIAVGDTGPGIPKETLSRIFDPFFTTKATGNGLGLTTSFSIIKKHGGLLTVDSEVNRGTVFHIYLPAARATDPGMVDVPHAGTATRENLCNRRILIMDDEQYIQEIAGSMLESAGCEVAFANEGAEALRLVGEATAAGRPFHCVLMDLTIPGKMGGREAIGRLRIYDKSIIALAVSGYTDDPLMANPRNYGFNGSITKPFKRKELLEELGKNL